ncbi:divergent polysaccharide deacetylase family protein [Sneathiella marina]|uniref:Divergent polysaccharide deacetylase family protein n=1 Tax=Sneathiella marina TaxID=2950108 RepID=A0ABY4VXL3_9PROT|nr:divergent polysaccharide deacetylase family protein [Sneathiella marina]USG59595.1 divergent polysaccharide deacetylase family protein [Sneathiella marina]
MQKQSRESGNRKSADRQKYSSDRLLDSPPRLIILCLAVLVISGSGGILLGKILTHYEVSYEISSVSAFFGPAETDEITTESPFSSNDYPFESPYTNNDYPLPDAKEKQLAALSPGQIDNLSADKPGAAAKLAGESAESNDQPPWKKYAVLAPPSNGRPIIALIIDDVGLSRDRVQALVDLPEVLTLAYLPYAPAVQSKVEMARLRGHEVMLHLPMQPSDDHTDPGPNALLVGLSDEEIRRRTHKNLDSFEGYVGVNNHMGSRFTADGRLMAIVMDIMAKRRLLFLDSKTTPRSTGYKLAVQRGMPSAKRDIFIDNVIEEGAILKQLAKVEKIANQKGVAIAIGHPHKQTISALRKWLPAAADKGFIFLPVSAITSLTFNG